MTGLLTTARFEGEVLIGGLFVVVAYKLFTGGIDLSGLLMAKDAKGNLSFSPGRAQMLMATVLTALYYVIQVMENPSHGGLPPLPGALVGVVGGSQAIYLLGKARHLLFKSPKDKS